LLITQKKGCQPPFLSGTIREVDDGGIQIGGARAGACPDDSEIPDAMARLARHAVSIRPALADVRVVRAGGADLSQRGSHQ